MVGRLGQWIFVKSHERSELDGPTTNTAKFHSDQRLLPYHQDEENEEQHLINKKIHKFREKSLPFVVAH